LNLKRVKIIGFRENIYYARLIAQKDRVKQKDESWYSKYFVRYFSIYLSYAFFKLGLSANFVTILMGLVGLCGFACLVLHEFWLNLSGFFIWQLWFILDCVDGEVARLHGKSSKLGKYLDAMTHIFVNPALILALGVHVCRVEYSLLNVVATFILYSAFHWHKQIRYVAYEFKIAWDKDYIEAAGFEQNNRRPWISFLSFIVGQLFCEIGQMFLIPLAILINYMLEGNFIKWFMYVYTVFFLLFIVVLMVRDSRKVRRLNIKSTPAQIY